MLGAAGPSFYGTLIARPGFFSPNFVTFLLAVEAVLIVVYLAIPNPVRPVPDLRVAGFTSAALPDLLATVPTPEALRPLGLVRPLAAPVPVYIVLLVG